MNDSMNKLILAAAGREDGDQPKPTPVTGMNRVLIESMPKSIQINFKKDE